MEIPQVDKMLEESLLSEGIRVTVGSGEKSAEEPKDMGEEKEHDPLSLELNIRKTLDGNYVIRDHIDMDIVVIPDESKIVAMPKEDNFDEDIVYSSQSELFNFLKDRGVIKVGSIQGGDQFAEYEAEYPSKEEAEHSNPLQVVLFTIGKFMEEERPYMDFDEEYFEKMTDRLVDPDDEETTELGDVPTDPAKGDIDQTTYPATLTYSQWY